LGFNYLLAHFWKDVIDQVIAHGLMPDKIQFWVRTFTDFTEWEKYDGRRLDLLHPVFSFDN
jgi:hypothetical protein